MAKVPNGKKYNGYELAISEPELDKILNEQSVKYVFNPTEEYSKLVKGDQAALVHLIKAAKALDPVFLKQDYEKNTEMKKVLQQAAAKGDTHASKALKLFEIFHGVEGHNGLSKEPIRIFKGMELAKTKNVYPTDLTKEELSAYLKANVEQAPAILSYDTIVRRENGRLVSVPYSIAFRKEYEEAAKELLLAANNTTHKGFANYLRLQAQALTSNDPEYSFKADEAWANLEDCPLEFTIGRESYEDTLTGSLAEDAELVKLLDANGISIKSKDFIGARVGIVDIPASKDLANYNSYLKDLSQLMPLKDTYTQSVQMGDVDSKVKQTLADVDLVYLSGDYAACRPGVTLAQNLPNDDKLSVQLNSGKRNVFHKQIRRTQDPEQRAKLLNALVDPAQHNWYDREADHLFTIGHELSHSLGPMQTASGKDKKASLGDCYGDIVEESKADLASLAGIEYFVKIGKYTPELANKIFLTWAVDQLPISEPLLTHAHRTREVMQLNYFIEKGTIKLEKGGKLSIVPEKMIPTARQMLKEVIEVQLAGNPVKAKEFVDKYRKWNDTLQYVSDTKLKLTPKPYKILQAPLADQLVP